MPYLDAQLFNHYKESGAEILGSFSALRREFANLNSDDIRTREAVLSLLTGAHEYDRGLGILFDRLTALDLLDKTTIVFFADHYNNTAADLLAPTGKAADPDFNTVVGGAQGKMLAYYIYSPVFENESRTENILIKDSAKTNAKLIREYKNPHYCEAREARGLDAKLGNPNTPEGVITKFITHFDIYSTICDIFHVQTNSRFTLGISSFREYENIGFSIKTGLIFNNKWATNTLSGTFPSSLSTGLPQNPDPIEIAAATARLSNNLAVMNNLRPYFINDSLRNNPAMAYTITTLPSEKFVNSQKYLP